MELYVSDIPLCKAGLLLSRIWIYILLLIFDYVCHEPERNLPRNPMESLLQSRARLQKGHNAYLSSSSTNREIYDP